MNSLNTYLFLHKYENLEFLLESYGYEFKILGFPPKQTIASCHVGFQESDIY